MDNSSEMLMKSIHSPFKQFIWRLHRYIGLFIAPFIFVASFTGLLYIATPQFEQYWYSSLLQVKPTGTMQPISRQVAAARAYYGRTEPIFAVRPAASEGLTTRVQFFKRPAAPSASIAVFVNPYTLGITGQTTVYGTSGLLPFRTWLDNLHQNLLLGSMGRAYSELAASWMWIAALGGIGLWWTQRRSNAKHSRKSAATLWHRRLGLFLVIGMLFLSITGITWSQWAGKNIASLRHSLNWSTPKVNDYLGESKVLQPRLLHAEHHQDNQSDATTMIPNISDKDWDHVLEAARNEGLQGAKLEIRPPKKKNYAWVVNEIDLRWPTQADSIAVEPEQFRVVDHRYFADFPLAAKLTRWGVDAHMGILFGLPNQLLLACFAIGLCVVICLGYRMAWRRRVAVATINPVETLLACFCNQRRCTQIIILILSVTLGWALPMLGASLLLFIAVDSWRWYWANKKAKCYSDVEALARVKRYRQFFGIVTMLLLIMATLLSQVLLRADTPLENASFATQSGALFSVKLLMTILYSVVISALLAIPLWLYLVGDSLNKS